MLRMFALAAMAALFAAPAAAQPDIEYDCTVNGHGKGMCTFHNKGTRDASMCVTLELAYTGSNPVIGEKTVKSDKPVCSGIVRGTDVVERNFTAFFDHSSPSDWCESKRGYRAGRMGWDFNCSFIVSPAPRT